uniref:hypothetical protein n=1 Tax=Candidatus Albibeggiatoa sp. nov. BB20 TaxID=3162723 RepID=UPI0033658F95
HPFHVARTYDVVAGDMSKKPIKSFMYRYLQYYTVYDTGQILGARLPSFFSEKKGQHYYPALFVDDEQKVMFGDFIQNSPDDDVFSFGRHYGKSNYMLKSKTVQLDADGQPKLRTYYNQGVSHYLPPRFYDSKLYYYSQYLKASNYKNPNEPIFEDKLKSKIGRGDTIVTLAAFSGVIVLFALLFYFFSGGYSIFFPSTPQMTTTSPQQQGQILPRANPEPEPTSSFFSTKPKHKKQDKPQTCDFFASLERFGYKQSFVKYPFLDVLRYYHYEITNYFIDQHGDIRFTFNIYDPDDRSQKIESYSDMDLKSWGFQVYNWGVDKDKLTLVLGDTMFFSFDTKLQSSNQSGGILSNLPF